MIYCFRFYFEEFPGITDGRKVLGLFDCISGILNCDFYRYFLDIFDEESGDDQDIVCDREERSEYAAQISDLFDEKGALRVDSICCGASTYTVPYGSWKGKPGITCGIVYSPEGMNWLKLDIIPSKKTMNMNRRIYAEILRALAEAGVSVNNSLAHCSIRCKAWYAFGGGENFGFEWPESRRIRLAVNRHHTAGHRDCLADVYWGNSLKADLLAPEDRGVLRELLGAENVWKSDGQFVFTLSDRAQDSGGIRAMRCGLNRMLEKYIAPETQKARR